MFSYIKGIFRKRMNPQDEYVLAQMEAILSSMRLRMKVFEMMWENENKNIPRSYNGSTTDFESV